MTRSGMSREIAETIGVQALGWVAGHDELCPVFLGSSGASAADLRQGMDDPALLASVLDFVMMDDAWVRAFCDAHGLDYGDPMRARYGLPGSEQVHWT